jgi:hypothetical protein
MRACAIAILLALPAVSAGDEAVRVSQEMKDQYVRAVGNTVAVIWNKAAPLLSEEDRLTLRKTRVEVQAASWDFYGLSPAPGGDLTIRLPIGLIIIQDYIDSAFIAENVGAAHDNALLQYIKLVAARVEEANMGDRSTSRVPEGIPPFPEFAKIAPEAWRELTQRQDFRAQKEVVKLSSLGFLLLHEFYHVLHPSESPATRETAADSFASDLGVRAQLNPMLAFYSFAIFAQIEGDQIFTHRNNFYPPAMCRSLSLVTIGMKQLTVEPGFKASLESQAKWEDWLAYPYRLRRILQEDGVTCDGVGLGADSADSSATFGTSHVIDIRIPRPTPGECDGLKFTIRVDGRRIANVDNTRSTAPVAIQLNGNGLHHVAFDGLTRYCIENEAPYHMRIIAQDLRCDASFVAGKNEVFDATIEFRKDGALKICGLR